MTESPAPPPEVVTASMAEEARRKVDELVEIQKATRLQGLVGLLAVVVIILVFGWVTYAKVKSNFETTRMEQQVAEKIQHLTPGTFEHLQGALAHAMPTYRELATQRIKLIGPDLQQKARAALEELPHRIQDDVLKDLRAAAERVGIRIQGDLKTTFPSLADKEEARVHLDRFYESLSKETNEVMDHAENLLVNEMHKLETVLVEFPVPSVEGVERYDLERQFVHLLLNYADYELLAAGTEEGLDVEAARD